LEVRPWPELQRLLPPLSSEERGALANSISSQNLLDAQKILVLPDGRIVDGYHRWELSGGRAPYKVLHNIDEESALLLGIRLNLARRQLSPEQKAELVKKLRRRGLSQKQIAEIMGISQKGVDHLESISIRKTTNAYTPPDLRLKVPREERERIYERVKAGEPQTQVVADYKITQPRVAQIVKQVEKTRKAEGSRGPQSPELDLPEEISVRIGDFREIARELPPESIDLVFTDPPYSEEHLELWESLGEVARRLLKPGRYLLAYVGKLYLPALMNALGKHLDYYWTAGKYFDQGHVFVRARKMWDQWRPILIFQKPGADSSHEWCLDMVRMGSREEAKRFHEQGQSSEMPGTTFRSSPGLGKWCSTRVAEVEAFCWLRSRPAGGP